jgi:hypothetical protein
VVSSLILHSLLSVTNFPFLCLFSIVFSSTREFCMATTARQPKPTRKGMPEPARSVFHISSSSDNRCTHEFSFLCSRPPAWTGARASPTFSPGSTSPRLSNGPPPGSQGAFPPLAQTNGTRTQENPQERVLQSLSGLTVRSFRAHNDRQLHLSLVAVGYNYYTSNQDCATL